MTLAEVPSVPVDSSLLASVSYASGESILRLELRDGAIYQYFDVPAEIYHCLLAAESKGNYFNRQIRSRFHYALLRPAR
jgi:hypothetical protein